MISIIQWTSKYSLSPNSPKIITGVYSRAKAIVEEARLGNYGTIVVGRRGLSKVQEFFIGRGSNQVIQLAKKKRGLGDELNS